MTPIDLFAGGTREFLGDSMSVGVGTGGVRRIGFVLTDAEIRSANGSLVLGLDASAAGGLSLVNPVGGASLLGLETIGNRSVALLRYETAGLHVLEVSSTGTISFELFLPGDLDGDNDVDGADRQDFETAAVDLDRNGNVDSGDEALLEINASYIANRRPVGVTWEAPTAYDGIPVRIDLLSPGSDPEGDPLSFSRKVPRTGRCPGVRMASPSTGLRGRRPPEQ